MPRVRRVIVSNEETQFTRLQVTSNAKARNVVSVVGGGKWKWEEDDHEEQSRSRRK
jgi:hypothetical protein